MRTAPSSLELSELAKSQHYPPISYDRTLSGQQVCINILLFEPFNSNYTVRALLSQSIIALRSPSTRHGHGPDSPDRSVMETDMGKGGMLGISRGLAPDSENTRDSFDWRSQRAVKRPDIVVTKTTVTTVG